MRRKTVKKTIPRLSISPEQKKFLESLLSAERIDNLHRVLDFRLGDITVVLDNLFDPHNIGAIIRTVEALGVQDIYIIEKDTEPDMSAKVTKYSDKWVSIHTYKNAEECVADLKKNKFTIIAAQMTKQAISSDEFKITQNSKIAIVVGNEHAGISEKIYELADVHVIVPMYGFTESFNVSVATALLLRDFVRKKRAVIHPETGTLNENRKKNLYNQWLQKAVKKSSLLLQAFEKQNH